MRGLRGLMVGMYAMPMPLRLGVLLLAGGGSLSMLMYVLWRFFGRAMWIVMLGVVFVVLLVVGFRALVKRMRRRKAAPMEKDIVAQSAAAPQAVSAASRRAALDDLRRNFEEGIAKFRAAGKDLYSVPWYVIVGEPGSGKTEAIRHSCIGFPPGLHDPLQGAGGTINMNWWFTTHGVILDTAGRLMFEEVPPGTTSEWQEFLRLLKAYRYNCPINGLLLVIPADTLITDTANEIKRKANRIAEQLHQIQRVLEVRFPVFVIITKCDLLNGFREFFEDVTDPDLQQQILGWSNPAPLDEPFDPEKVSEHLEAVCQRLRRRRLTLLLDPVHTENPEGRRLDQVDALYALPQSIARLAPRLRHYLDHVFAGGEWTGKPLFLRGIYFTSSMREGNPLDEELAEALGVPVTSLPEVREWDKERSYFLRDVFIQKVFKESGLVTRAAHAGRLRRRRKVMVLAAGFASVLALAIFTWFGAASLRRSIGIHRDYWLAAAQDANWKKVPGQDVDYWRPIVAPAFQGTSAYVYVGDSPVAVGQESVPLIQFHRRLVELSAQPIRIPWVFLLARIGADISGSRREALRMIVERSILRPLLDAARSRLRLPDDPDKRKAALETNPLPDESFSNALAQLIIVESPKPPPPDLGQLFQCVLYRGPKPPDIEQGARLPEAEAEERARREKEYAVYQQNLQRARQDQEVLARALDVLYRDGTDARPTLAGTGAATQAARQAIDDGLARYLAHWSQRAEKAQHQLARVIEAKDAVLKDFSAAEQRLLELDDDFLPRLERPGSGKTQIVRHAATEWTARLTALGEARQKVEAALKGLPFGPLFPVFKQTSDAIVHELQEEFARFRQQAGIAPPPPADKPETKNQQAKAQPEKPENTEKTKEKAAKVATAIKAALGAGKPSPQEIRWKQLADEINSTLDARLTKLRQQAELLAVPEEVRRADAGFLDVLQVPKRLWDRLLAEGAVRQEESNSLRLYQLRVLMYRLANSEFARKNPEARAVSFRKQVAALANSVARTCAQVRDLRDVKPGAFRFQDAANVSTFAAARLALPGRVTALLEAALDKAPKTEDEVAARVEKLADKLPAIPRPRIPLTATNGGTYSPKFHPKALLQALAECDEAGEVLADQKLEVLERDRLRTKWQTWRSAITRYLTGAYLAYWTQTVPTDLASKGKDWPSYRRGMAASDIFEVFIALGDVGKTIGEALSSKLEASLSGQAKGEFAAAREAAQAQLRKLKNEIYQHKCRTVRTNWLKLGDNVLEARRRLASTSDDDVFENYLPFDCKAPADYADRYWRDLTHEALRLIAEGAAREGRTRYQEFLKRFARFPLNLPVEGQQPLTAAQLNAARDLVKLLVLSAKTDEAIRKATAGERKLEGTRAVVQQMLRRLRVLNFTEAERTWLRRVNAVLDGLPTGENVLKCSVWVPRQQPDPAVGVRWVHIRINQGGREIGKGNTQPATDYKLCEVEYPGQKLEIRLYRNPVDPTPNRALDLPGPWAPLRLLHRGSATDPLYIDKHFTHSWQAEASVEKQELLDTAKRNVVLTFEDDQRRKRKLRLRLVFEKKLPRIEDWPAAASQ